MTIEFMNELLTHLRQELKQALDSYKSENSLLPFRRKKQMSIIEAIVKVPFTCPLEMVDSLQSYLNHISTGVVGFFDMRGSRLKEAVKNIISPYQDHALRVLITVEKNRQHPEKGGLCYQEKITQTLRYLKTSTARTPFSTQKTSPSFFKRGFDFSVWWKRCV